MTGTRTEALVAYMAMLKKHNVRRSEVFRREHVARFLIARLNGESATNEDYRAAVCGLLESMSNESNRAFFVMAAREFFPFLVGDFRLIAKISEVGGYRDIGVLPEGLQDMNFTCFDEFVEAAAGYVCEDGDLAALDRYAAFLGKEGLDGEVAWHRCVLARGLLMLLQGAPVNGKTYRVAADRVSLFFAGDEMRIYFLNVARQAFPFIRHEDSSEHESLVSS